MNKYRVEIFINNNWVCKSWYKNEELANASAEKLYKNRKCDVRVVKNGQIVQFYYGG